MPKKHQGIRTRLGNHFYPTGMDFCSNFFSETFDSPEKGAFSARNCFFPRKFSYETEVPVNQIKASEKNAKSRKKLWKDLFKIVRKPHQFPRIKKSPIGHRQHSGNMFPSHKPSKNQKLSKKIFTSESRNSEKT